MWQLFITCPTFSWDLLKSIFPILKQVYNLRKANCRVFLLRRAPHVQCLTYKEAHHELASSFFRALALPFPHLASCASLMFNGFELPTHVAVFYYLPAFARLVYLSTTASHLHVCLILVTLFISESMQLSSSGNSQMQCSSSPHFYTRLFPCHLPPGIGLLIYAPC